MVGTGYSGNPDQGRAVALSRDGSTLAVGGPHDTPAPNANPIGAVWIFTRSGGLLGSYTQQAKLVGTGVIGTNGADQGNSVGLSYDGNTVVVGGFLDNSGQGATWIFVRLDGGTTWTQQQKLVAGAIGTASQQGISVAISADGNTVAVGGPGDDSSGANAGSVWIFIRLAEIWYQQGAKLFPTDGGAGTFFGNSVALSADGNTLAAGGFGDSNFIGASWIYTRDDGVWSQQTLAIVGAGYEKHSGRRRQPGHLRRHLRRREHDDLGRSRRRWYIGAAWLFRQLSPGVWVQYAEKFVGTGFNLALDGFVAEGNAVAISGDASIFLVQALDNAGVGATWSFTQNQILQIGSNVDLQGNNLYGVNALSLAEAPPIPGAILWFIDSTGTLQWVPAGSTLIRTGTAADYSALATDALIAVTDTSAPRTITLPAASFDSVGKVFIVKDEQGEASLNNISVIVSGGGLLDGGT